MISSCIFCFLTFANRVLNARNDGRYRLEIVLDYHALKWDSSMCVCLYFKAITTLSTQKAYNSLSCPKPYIMLLNSVTVIALTSLPPTGKQAGTGKIL